MEVLFGNKNVSGLSCGSAEVLVAQLFSDPMGQWVVLRCIDSSYVDVIGTGLTSGASPKNACKTE
jgi:hypothetical protein